MYLTDKKVAVMGAAGAIGSNMVQDLLSTGTANNIAMYDPFEQGLEGAAEEIYHCGFPGARGFRVVTYRVFSESGREVRRERLSDDTYQPMDRLIQVTESAP